MNDQRCRALQKKTLLLRGERRGSEPEASQEARIVLACGRRRRDAYFFQHRDQLVVCVLRGEFQVRDETVHLGEREDDRDALRDGLADAALGVQHNAFYHVYADDAAVGNAKT